MAAKSPLAIKPRRRKKEIKAHTIPLEAKEATIYGINLFLKVYLAI